jgi:threonine/homoserine efflux transporter RhtA
VAKAAFRELIDLFISDATTGVVYLEGWEADNIRLNQIGAILAAACGETHTAYTLLQYLQNERSSNTLITALMAGTLLQHCYAAPASAALRTSYIYRRVDIEGFEDFCLKLSDFSLLNLDNVSGDIDFTIIER